MTPDSESIDSPQQHSTRYDEISPDPTERRRTSTRKFYEQFVECVNLGNYEDFADGCETAELLRNNTSKSGDVQISLKKYITPESLIEVPLETTEMNDDLKKLYEQIVEYTKT